MTTLRSHGPARASRWLIRLAACAVLMAGTVPAAHAETSFGEGCMQTTAGFNLNCNSNDVRIAGVATDSQGDPLLTIHDNGCAFPGDTVNFTATFDVLLGAQARYDIGIYFVEDGDPNDDGALTGTCSITTLDADNTPGFINLDASPDTCGDIDAAHNPLHPEITLTAVCIDDDDNGLLNLPNCLSWRQPGANDVCDEPSDAFPGSPSKCRCDAGFNVPIDVPSATIQVVKTASPDTLAEPGGSVTYTVTITNFGIDPNNPFTVDALDDDVFGDLNGQGDCSVPQEIDPGELNAYTCQFTKSLTGDGGSTHTNTVTASGADTHGNEGEASDDADVTFTNVDPIVNITKSANPTQVAEPAANVTFTVTVTNNSNTQDPVTITSLSDDQFGTLAGDADCQVGTTLQPGASCSFTFVGAVNGNAGFSHTNTVTVNVVDNDDATDSDSASATVTVTNTPGQIRVTKTATPSSLSEPGGTVRFDVKVENLSTVDSVTLQRLSDVVEGGAPINLDGVGTCDVPQALAPLGGGTSIYECWFELALTGNADDSRTDVVRAAGIDDDGEQVFASDDAIVNFTDAPPAASIVKSVTQVVATYEITVSNQSAAEELYLSSLLDDKFGELIGPDKPCGASTITLAPKGQTGDSHTCTFDRQVTESPHTNTVEATASDDEGTDITPKPSDDATVTFE
jgi:uncharacterized repeat protein (TIGR01451 family)